MQSLAFLWGQLQIAQQYLREEICPPEQVPGNAANLDSPTDMTRVRQPFANQVARMKSAQKPRASVPPSNNLFRLIGSRSAGRNQIESRRRVVKRSR
jgi:hypothetical protein